MNETQSSPKDSYGPPTPDSSSADSPNPTSPTRAGRTNATATKDWLFDQDITIASHHSFAVDIHHVFPKKWCVDNRVDDLRRERIVNKTAIAATTNRKIGGRAPSKYLPLLQKEAETTREELRRRVEQHHVDFDALEGDNFDTHFERRRQRLLDLIGEAMGKDIAIPAIPSLPEDFDLDEEEPSDDDIAEEDS